MKINLSVSRALILVLLGIIAFFLQDIYFDFKKVIKNQPTYLKTSKSVENITTTLPKIEKRVESNTSAIKALAVGLKSEDMQKIIDAIINASLSRLEKQSIGIQKISDSIVGLNNNLEKIRQNSQIILTKNEASFARLEKGFKLIHNKTNDISVDLDNFSKIYYAGTLIPYLRMREGVSYTSKWGGPFEIKDEEAWKNTALYYAQGLKTIGISVKDYKKWPDEWDKWGPQK